MRDIENKSIEHSFFGNCKYRGSEIIDHESGNHYITPNIELTDDHDTVISDTYYISSINLRRHRFDEETRFPYINKRGTYMRKGTYILIIYKDGEEQIV